MTSWSSGTVRVSGGALAYHRTAGRGPSLVLSHGLTDNGLCWRRLASALEGRFDIVMLDARGHGASTRLTGEESFDPSRDLGEAIAALGLQTPIVMGHSVGAWATAAHANNNPDGVAKVVLEDPPFRVSADAPPSAARRQKFREMVERYRSMSDAGIDALGQTTHPDWRPEDRPDWAAAKRQVDPAALPELTTSWRELVDRIAVPTLLVHGEVELGSLVTPAIAEEAMSLNANIQAVQIKGAGHNVRRENFPLYLEAVQWFLSGSA
ncbi:alpha/beta hydrolase [Phenylobacterium sp.]|uniref:alpha/beta fold hydrolase n=1 Tax=Phenylobacterium sp. TaxID=1871053 RepID=UPI00286D4C8D|nr:alpha/beta hydrolase [Phenylobacterium sp.]